MYTYDQNGQAPGSGNPDTVIAYNCVHDMPMPQRRQASISSNGSTNYMVDHNLVYDVSCAMVLNEPSTYRPRLHQHAGRQWERASAATRRDHASDSAGTYVENNHLHRALPIWGSNYANYADNPPDSTDTAADFANPAVLNFQLQSDLAGGERRHGDSRLYQRHMSAWPRTSAASNTGWPPGPPGPTPQPTSTPRPFPPRRHLAATSPDAVGNRSHLAKHRHQRHELRGRAVNRRYYAAGYLVERHDVHADCFLAGQRHFLCRHDADHRNLLLPRPNR